MIAEVDQYSNRAIACDPIIVIIAIVIVIFINSNNNCNSNSKNSKNNLFKVYDTGSGCSFSRCRAS